MRKFHATNRDGTCLWCGHKLPIYNKKRGYMDAGFFCTATCGWQFGLTVAEHGTRLTAMADAPAKEKRGHASPRCPECKRALLRTASMIDKRWYCQNRTLNCSMAADHAEWEWTDETSRDALRRIS